MALMTHEQLVVAGAKWIKRVWRAPVVATELVTSAMETCDVIGWNSHGRSIVLEAKTSIADFKADLKKPFRKFARAGVGDYRYFITEPGLLRGALLPDGWGLLEVGANVQILLRSHAADCYCREVEKKRNVDYCSPAFRFKAMHNEALMLMSICRRLAGPCGIRGRTTVDIDAYEKDEKGRKL